MSRPAEEETSEDGLRRASRPPLVNHTEQDIERLLRRDFILYFSGVDFSKTASMPEKDAAQKVIRFFDQMDLTQVFSDLKKRHGDVTLPQHAFGHPDGLKLPRQPIGAIAFFYEGDQQKERHVIETYSGDYLYAPTASPVEIFSEDENGFAILAVNLKFPVGTLTRRILQALTPPDDKPARPTGARLAVHVPIAGETIEFLKKAFAGKIPGYDPAQLRNEVEIPSAFSIIGSKIRLKIGTPSPTGNGSLGKKLSIGLNHKLDLTKAGIRAYIRPMSFGEKESFGIKGGTLLVYIIRFTYTDAEGPQELYTYTRSDENDVFPIGTATDFFLIQSFNHEIPGYSAKTPGYLLKSQKGLPCLARYRFPNGRRLHPKAADS